MNETYFSVSLNGRFVFRTDIITEWHAAAITERALADAFGALPGYVIERSDRPSVWNVKAVTK